jgi:sarcosine oxidase, subunit beta
MTTVVVGGGIMGACTAYELARAGESTVLLEAGTFADPRAGTAKSAAIVRMHYSNPEVVQMAVTSRAAFMEQPFYERCGWLFLVDEKHAAAARRNREMQQHEGALSDEIDPQDFGIEADGIAYALFEADSGFADPVAATRFYVDAARREGADVREHAAVDDVELARGVRVEGTWIEAENIVVAAGAWSKRLAATVGLDLPLEFPREQEVLFATSGGTSFPHAVSSQADAAYFRPAGDGSLLAGRGYPKDYELVDPERYDETADAAFEEDLRTRLCTRLRALGGLTAVGGTVGLYEVTPDWHPILGAVDGYDGLFLATGGSGHGFKIGPAIGELVAGAVLGRDVGNTFSLSRFDEGRELSSAYGGNRA